MNTQETLAEIVRRERLAHSWSQDQLALAAGLNLRTVQRVERGAACSGETLQALAAALNLDTLKLTTAAPRAQQQTRVLGLSRRQSMWIGVALCLPALIFVVLNVGYYELSLSALEPIMTSSLWNSVADGYLTVPLILGGPAIAVVLNIPYLVQIRANAGESMTTVNGLVFRWSTGQWLVIGLALALLATIVLYGAIENLHHMVLDQLR